MTRTELTHATIKDDLMDLITVFMSLFAVVYVGFFSSLALYVITTKNHVYFEIEQLYTLIPTLAIIAFGGALITVLISILCRIIIRRHQNKLMKLYASVYVTSFSSMTKKEEKKEAIHKGVIHAMYLFRVIVPFWYITELYYTLGEFSNDLLSAIYAIVTTIVIMIGVAAFRYRHLVPHSLKEATELLSLALWRY